MNRRQTVLILILLTAMLCLAAAVISSRVSGVRPEPADTESQPVQERGTVELFPDSNNGRWGARTANGRILIEPTWYFLRKMSDTVLIARDSDGKADRFGLITITGEQLVPFLYHAIVHVDATDLWIASFTENGMPKYHLYHDDGTRWSDTAWDTCTYEDGVLSVSLGTERYEGIMQDGRIVWQYCYTEYPVGLHKLTVELDERALAQIPPGEDLTKIGDAAAQYLLYLFVTKQEPEAELISAREPASVCVDDSYRYCRLISAEMRRIKMLETKTLPICLTEMKVVYQREEEDGTKDRVVTTMQLVLSHNVAGAYAYYSFSDTQLDAAGLLE